MAFLTKRDGYQKKCDRIQNVTKMGIITQGGLMVLYSGVISIN
jgi:hypothetical protein